MSFAKFCIQHRVATILSVIITIIFGLAFSLKLQVALLPSIEVPSALIICYYSGAVPADVEENISRPLESACMLVPGVTEVYSRSYDSFSALQVYYDDGTDLDLAATRLREQFDSLDLPDGATSPTILNIDISQMMPTCIIALQGDDLHTLQAEAEDIIVPALERIDGIASVSIAGGAEQQVSVILDSARIEGYGISSNYIAQFLAAENVIYPGGSVYNGTRSYTAFTDAKFVSLDDVSNTIIPLPTGGTIRLNEIATVTMEDGSQNTTAKMHGKECVILSVSKQSGANEARSAEAVEKQMKILSSENNNLNYYIVYSSEDYITTAIESAIQNMLLGVVLAAVVVFLFLFRIGPTMTIVISMPVCIMSVFILMNACDITMNMLSLGGIAMGVGMIVDNSIVVLENVYRFMSEGHDRLTACVDGTKEVTNSILASTLTTVAVFLPLGLTGGTAGMLFRDFCLTIAFLILASLVVALSWVPLLCYLMSANVKVGKNKHFMRISVFSNLKVLLSRAYEAILSFLMSHLFIGMITCVAVVVLCIMVSLKTNMVLLPEMDQGQINVNVSLPTGSSVQEAINIAEQVVTVIEREVPELENCYYTTTDHTGLAAVMSAADITVGLNLIDKSERNRTAVMICNDLRGKLQDIAGCEISIVVADIISSLGFSSSELSLEINGDDLDVLNLIAEDLVSQIEAIPDTVDVVSSISARIPQIEISLNRQVASQYNLTAAQIGAAVRTELTGVTATTLTINNKEYDVIIKGDGIASRSIDALRSLQISTPLGGTVPLSYLANVNVIQAPQEISRHDQSRQVRITGSTISGNTTAATLRINEIIDSYPVPEGYAVSNAGSFEDMMEYYGDLLLALLVAVGLVYFILAAQFESFIMPVIVMFIIPVAFSGGLVSLPLTGKDFSMISIVALIMLAGTVVNSSIILVDYINIRRRLGESRREAIIHACPLRVRPVLMTAITTILAIFPMALGWGNTNEMMTDMGITMMGGMIVSTIITLIFTPIFYCVIDNISNLFKRKEKDLL